MAVTWEETLDSQRMTEALPGRWWGKNRPNRGNGTDRSPQARQSIATLRELSITCNGWTWVAALVKGFDLRRHCFKQSWEKS